MKNLFWGILLILFGILFLLDNLGFADFGDVIKTFWPLIFILWGINILFRKKADTVITVDTEVHTIDNDLLHRSNVFGDVSMGITSTNFKGGSISNVFGDCEIDMTKSILADGEHLLKVHSIFGDTIIFLPKDSGISVTASVLIGDLKVLGQSAEGFSKDIHVTTPDYQTAQKKLSLSITHVFGSVKIIQQ